MLETIFTWTGFLVLQLLLVFIGLFLIWLTVHIILAIIDRAVRNKRAWTCMYWYCKENYEDYQKWLKEWKT